MVGIGIDGRVQRRFAAACQTGRETPSETSGPLQGGQRFGQLRFLTAKNQAYSTRTSAARPCETAGRMAWVYVLVTVPLPGSARDGWPGKGLAHTEPCDAAGGPWRQRPPSVPELPHLRDQHLRCDGHDRSEPLSIPLAG